jgi:orotate phosphoribosyltransferase
MDVSLHHLCTWWDVLEVCRTVPYFGDDALAEVRKFLDDPVTWSKSRGGIGSTAEAKAGAEA